MATDTAVTAVTASTAAAAATAATMATSKATVTTTVKASAPRRRQGLVALKATMAGGRGS